ncbi:MAG TPA: isoprenylcysteine carboxylmethyltransferase family protein [Streptosporangiaceae bacterium]|nr:isoprenylcysteine carboxylmethyltransferase family protein [Streptosporangiaceae bacterium]
MADWETARDPAESPFLHMPVPWVFVASYLLGAALQLLAPARLNPAGASVAIRIAGCALFLAGAGLAAWALLLFRNAATTTVPGEPARQLVTRGPYRLTRNPMYLGLVLAYLGEAGLLVQPWPLLFLPLAVAYVNWFVIPVEEATLGQFEEFRNYCATVRRWL